MGTRGSVKYGEHGCIYFSSDAYPSELGYLAMCDRLKIEEKVEKGYSYEDALKVCFIDTLEQSYGAAPRDDWKGRWLYEIRKDGIRIYYKEGEELKIGMKKLKEIKSADNSKAVIEELWKEEGEEK